MGKHWLIIGGSGMLGVALSRYLLLNGHKVTATSHSHALTLPDIEPYMLDLTQDFSADTIINAVEPDTVIYVAGLTNVDACEANEPLARRLHAEAPAEFATACKNRIPFISISTDHLWDGTKPLRKEDEPLQPLNAYARTKAEGESLVLENNPETLVLRTNFFGQGLPWRPSLSDWMLHKLQSGERLNAFTDAYFTPIVMPLLSETIYQAHKKGLSGIYNACGATRISKYDFASKLAEAFDLPTQTIHKSTLTEANLKAPRPADMSLDSKKIASALGRLQPDLKTSLSVLKEQILTTHCAYQNEA